MDGKYSISIKEAVQNYPVLKRTVDLAKEFNIELLFHYAKFTKKGKVYQHMFVTRDSEGNKDWQRNQDLLNWLKNCKDYQKNFKSDEKN
jgi:hypothetical protein